MKSFYAPKDVASLVGISYRQIQYWDKTNFIKPSYRRAGKYRLYTFSDLIQLKVAKTLRDNNFSIQRLRKTIKSLRSILPQVAHPMTDLTFLINHDQRVLVFNGEVLMNSDAAQGYVRFDVSNLKDEVNRMFPDYAESATVQKTHKKPRASTSYMSRRQLGDGSPAMEDMRNEIQTGGMTPTQDEDIKPSKLESTLT